MYKLDIGVGYSIFQMAINPFGPFAGLFNYIGQHRIILNETIINYYYENIPDEYFDQLDTYINSIINNDECSASSLEIEVDARQNILNSVIKVPMRVLVTGPEEFSEYDCRKATLVTPESIFNHDENVFNMYTFPLVNYVARADSHCDTHAVWLGRLFENEKSITIVDPYIFSWDGRVSFEKYILTHITEGTDIDIYCNCSKEIFPTEEELQRMIHSKYNKWNVRIHLCRIMHERFINLSTVQISIGKGIGFLHPCGRVDKDCIISISKGMKLPIPTDYRCLY